MKTHELKIWAIPFELVSEGKKTAEYRINDRNFLCGDRLLLREWITDCELFELGRYTGREILVEVTSFQEGPSFGIPEEYCVMSIKIIAQSSNRKEMEKHL